ncbi:MAG: GMC family oxidoreductase N-terminal domain-containing protein [Pseudomonadota bacterium]|nr:GMC family oxidoreductase N-terminal domain-containing protein [Pseudomonadota bacterium]
MREYSHIIVGGGAAGSVMANRLSASGAETVLVIEAGPDVPPDDIPPDIRSIYPLSYFNQAYMWPDTRVYWRKKDNSRMSFLPQGRVLGGSSQIMGMWALRGHPSDYDDWAEMGAPDWSWDKVKPYFRRLETDIDFPGGDHGSAGPLEIRRGAAAERGPVAAALARLSQARGWDEIADMNVDFRDGHCALPISRGVDRRGSAGLNYLDAEARARPNLEVLTRCHAEQVIFENGRAAGVRYRDEQGGLSQVRGANVILTAGALRSPLLLMRSGIGPADMLRAAGIDVQHDLPGVGAGLQNHAVIYVTGMLTPQGQDPKGVRPPGSTLIRWTSGGEGGQPADMAMYIRSDLSWHALGRKMASLAPALMRPASTGSIRLSPEGEPLIEFDMFSAPNDLERLKDGVRLTVELFNKLHEQGLSGKPMLIADAAGLGRYNNVTRWNALRAWAAATLIRVAPRMGQALVSKLADFEDANAIVADDRALTAFVEAAVTGTGHICGTCRIGGADDPLAVVDQAGHVHGIEGLMVADASVMPRVPAANTHIPTVMVAEKVASGLVGDFSA